MKLTQAQRNQRRLRLYDGAMRIALSQALIQKGKDAAVGATVKLEKSDFDRIAWDVAYQVSKNVKPQFNVAYKTSLVNWRDKPGWKGKQVQEVWAEDVQQRTSSWATKKQVKIEIDYMGTAVNPQETSGQNTQDQNKPTPTPTPTSTPTPTLTPPASPSPTATPTPSPSPSSSPAPASTSFNSNAPLSLRTWEKLRQELVELNKPNPDIKPEDINKAMVALERNVDRRNMVQLIKDSKNNDRVYESYYLNLGRNQQGIYEKIDITWPSKTKMFFGGRFEHEFYHYGHVPSYVWQRGTNVVVAKSVEEFKDRLIAIQRIRERAQMPVSSPSTDEQRVRANKSLNDAVAALRKEKRISIYGYSWSSPALDSYFGWSSPDEKSQLRQKFNYDWITLRVLEKNGKKFLEEAPGDYSSFFLDNIEGEGLYDRRDENSSDKKIPLFRNIDQAKARLTELLNEPKAMHDKSGQRLY